jgi:hypothetical protein
MWGRRRVPLPTAKWGFTDGEACFELAGLLHQKVFVTRFPNCWLDPSPQSRRADSIRSRWARLDRRRPRKAMFDLEGSNPGR